MNDQAGDAGNPGAMGDERAFERLCHELAHPWFHDILRPEPVKVNSDGSVVVRLPFRSCLGGGRERSFFHGGAIASLVDITGHAAIAIQTGCTVPTIDLRVDYISAATDRELIATGKAVSVGRSVGRADVEIRGDDGRLVASGRAVFSTLRR